MSESAEEYFTRVEEHFGRRRGGPLVLAPKDWRLLERWHSAGIPLRVVLRGINRAFDRFAASGPRPDRINSLRYCEQEVEAAWEEFRSSGATVDAAGASLGLPAAAVHLVAVAAACRTAADGVDSRRAAFLRDAAAEIDELQKAAAAGSLGAGAVDDRASRIERGLRGQLEDLGGEPIELPRFSPYDA